MGIDRAIYQSIHHRAFSRLPDPALRCAAAPCPGPHHVYAAINLGLNAVAHFKHPRIRLPPYIFKVGTTLSCGGRRSGFGRATTLHSAEAIAPWRGDARYAGFDDWRITGCWPVPAGLPDNEGKYYDREVFWKWVYGRGPRGRKVDGVEGVGSDHLLLDELTPGGAQKTTQDLYVMKDAFLAGGRSGLAAHDLHDRMLATVRDAILTVVQPMIRELAAARGP